MKLSRIAFFGLLVLALRPALLTAQSEADVKRELDKRGINTLEEIQSELRKRGMTEADARRQARLYGLDYDEYISKYVTNQKASTSISGESIQSISIDTVDYTTEIVDNASQQAPVIEVDPHF